MAFVHPKKVISQCGINAGMIVADFGSGSGAYVKEVLACVGTDGLVYAIDIQQTPLDRLKNDVGKGEKRLVCLCADLEMDRGSSLANESVDLVIISNILFQVEAREQIFKEAYRILRPKGRVLVVEWKSESDCIGPSENQRLSFSEICSIAEQAGCIYEESIDVGEHHNGCIMRKRN